MMPLLKVSNEMNVSYAMELSSESQIVRYRSGGYFTDNEGYKPALEVLYEKRSYKTEF